MRKTKKIHLLGPCQHEGPIWWKMLSFSWKTYIFEAMSWTKFDHNEQEWLSKLTSDPVRRMLAQWPSEMSWTRALPPPPPLPSFPLPSLPPLSSLPEPLKPYNSLGKKRNWCWWCQFLTQLEGPIPLVGSYLGGTPCRNEFGTWFAFLFIVFRSPWEVVEHRHGDDPSFEFCWLFAHFWQELLDSVAKLQCGESWEIFHSNSTGSPSIVSKVLCCGELLNHVNLSSQTIFDCGFSFIFPRHNTESENTWTSVCERLMTSSSPFKDKCFHEESSQ